MRHSRAVVPEDAGATARPSHGATFVGREHLGAHDQVPARKLPLPASPYDFVPSRLATTRTDTLPISASHALRIGLLPSHHRDPFDRMIIAQALVEGVPVLTAGRAFRRYAVDHLSP
ncbi:MAG TPA: type II toxin-antitoxin system VapC family toxin [Candidatus Binatia bacterium]|nr:type II toxin-antitoxin system VapC family toxin [Candidatus Binatia bacterium]